MGKVENLVAKIKAKGLKVTLGLYNTMMDDYAQHHDESKCFHFFHKL